VRLFELGRAYFPRVFEASDTARLPVLERRTLGVTLAGLREERSWDAAPAALDFFDLKGIAEELLAYCGVANYIVEPAGHPILHPGRAARLRLADRRGRPSTELAVLGEVHPEVAARFDLDQRALLMELDVDALAAVAVAGRTYQEVSRFPAIHRDLAVVVATSTPAAEVLRAVRQGGGKLLRSVNLFDVYRGEQVGEGKQSLALSLVFQSPDETLTERTIDGVVENIQRRLRETVGATFRA
jgi:phenylalanyl-tRNA synthetase beta chain